MAQHGSPQRGRAPTRASVQWRADVALEQVFAHFAHRGGPQPCLAVVDATQPNEPRVLRVVPRGDAAGVSELLAFATSAGPLGAQHAAAIRDHLAGDNIVFLASLRDGSTDIVRQPLRRAD